MMTVSRDPDVVRLQRESLRLIVASEKVLAALEEHITLLRKFVNEAESSHPRAVTEDQPPRARGVQDDG